MSFRYSAFFDWTVKNRRREKRLELGCDPNQITCTHFCGRSYFNITWMYEQTVNHTHHTKYIMHALQDATTHQHAYWKRPLSSLPTPIPLRPGAHRFAWEGGLKMEEGRVNTAEPNHIRLPKKGTREGEDEKRIRAEEKSLTGFPQWATEMKNRSYTSCRRQAERDREDSRGQRNVHMLFSSLSGIRTENGIIS